MGRNWAITIGINRYRNLKALDYALQDAEAVKHYLQVDLKCPKDHVYHFSDNSPPIPQDYGPALDSLPTYATLRRFLRVRFEEPFLRPGDNLWFFFAGHGRRHEDRDYLMPIDADPGDVESTAIPLHYVTERLQRCGADNVILFIDACRSKTGRRDGLGVGQERQQGVITFFSCRPEESSYEIEELQQGAFTHALLESLKLQGEGNCATVERLYQRLCRTVPELNQRYQKPIQHPYGRIEPPTKNYLILLPQQAQLTDVLALKNSAMAAELRRDYALAKQFWIRVLAVSPADLDGIEGIERLATVSARPPAPEPEPLPPPPEPTSRGGFSAESPPQSDVVIEAPPEAEVSVTDSPMLSFEVITVNSQGRETQREQKQAEFRREQLGDKVTLDLMRIPAGKFMMGQTEAEKAELIRQVGEEDYQKYYARELPQHQVAVSPFWMGKYAVTQAQWQAVAALPKVERDLDADPSNFKGENRPVEQVSWQDATEFCARLSKHTGREYRLPSEAEWEYACRSGTTTPFHFGETITTDIANYDGNYTYGGGPKGQYREETTAVGSFSVANSFGLYDMHGNVWEWCLDYGHETYEGAPTDGSAWITGGNDSLRMLRGGSWVNLPRYCRSALRYWVEPDYWFGNLIGFRVVCSTPWEG
jgi:formylglycine-generating enzyme required for sulfatase activity/uncharacterized caspase-like protein